MTIKLKIPKIRFKEFSSEWEEKKLGEISENIKSGKSQNNDFGNYDLYGSTGIIGKCENYSNDGNYILVARVGANAGSLNLVNGKFGVTDNALIIDLDNKNNIGFIYNFLYNLNLNKLVFGSGQPLVTGTQLKNIKINLPSLPEQQRIASFLSSVDEKIEKIKEKKKNLEEYKKGVMQKIFSQEIRFKDENGEEFGEWEEKKLGKLSKITTGKLDANAMVENGEYRFYTCAKDYFKIDKFAFDTEALLVSGNGANVGYIHYYKGKFNAYQRTYVLDGFKDNIIFIKYFLEKNLSKRIGEEKNEGNTPYIVIGTLSNLIINLPTLKEQEKIADFLSEIDEKIEKVSDELEKMEEFKKGLLQRMFV